METAANSENPPRNNGTCLWPLARWGASLLGNQRGDHVCVTAILIPCLVLATFILCLLGTRYEHLAELANFMLNYTLILSRQSHP